MPKNSKYVYVWDYKSDRYPFQIFIGGRGTGKTYGCLDGALNGQIEKGKKFIFMRRTKNELDLLMDASDMSEGVNPFKKINKDQGKHVGIKSIRESIAGIYNKEETEEGKEIYAGAPIGYALALSTIATIRGVDLTDASDWIYDEFIPESHVRKMKNEGEALLNAYETINRNREIEGEAPLRLWLLANAFDIYNAIFQTLGIVSHVEKMIRKGQQHSYLEDRGLAIHLLENTSEYVEEKAQTALYRLTKGTRFYDMALNNNFAYNDFSCIAYRNISGYRPICSVDNAYIYVKKGDREIYITYTPARCPSYSSSAENERRLFNQKIGHKLYKEFVNGSIIFESFDLKQKILDLIL